MSRNEAAGSYGQSMFNCKILLVWLYYFSFLPQHRRVPVASHLHQHVILSGFRCFSSVGSHYGCWWYFSCANNYTVVSWTDSICISLETNDDEHLFICISAFHTSSLVKCPFDAFDHFLFGLFLSHFVEFREFLYILDASLLPDMCLADVFC